MNEALDGFRLDAPLFGTFLGSIQSAFAGVQCFSYKDYPVKFNVIPAMVDGDTSEVAAVYSGNFVGAVRRIIKGNGEMIYMVDSVINGVARKIEFANFRSVFKANKYAIVVAALGPDHALKMRGDEC